MKIERPDSNRADEMQPHSGHHRGRQGAPGLESASASGFLGVMDELETKRLLENLEILGSQLSRFPTMTLLHQYRGLVKQLLDKVRRNMHNKKEYKWRRTERSMFVYVERVEDALTELEEGLLREGERIKMLQLMEEIKGCLISLLF